MQLLFLWPSFCCKLWSSGTHSGSLWSEDYEVSKLWGQRTEPVLLPQVISGGSFCIWTPGETKDTLNHLSSVHKTTTTAAMEVSLLLSPGRAGQCSIIWWLGLTDEPAELCFCCSHYSGPLPHSDMASLYPPSLMPSASFLCAGLLVLLPFFYLLPLFLHPELKFSQRPCDQFSQILSGTLQ